MQQVIEMSSEHKAILFEAANKLGDRMEEVFTEAVNNVAWEVNCKQADDPDNPVYDKLVRINQHAIPRAAWRGVERMRSAGLAERAKAPQGSGAEVNALEAGLKAVIEALILLVQQLLGNTKESSEYMHTGDVPRLDTQKSLRKGEEPTL